MPIIVVGTLVPEQTKLNKDGDTRWIRGTIRLAPTCRYVLSVINQHKLPFTFVTGQVIPPGQVIIMGEITEYQIPNSNKVWKTLDIQRIITSGSPVLDALDVTFNEACRLVEHRNQAFMERLGFIRLVVRKQLVDLLGDKNKFADTLLEKFDEDAYVRLVSDPWDMIHIIPYYTITHADAVAKKLGLDTSDPRRFYAYFRYLLDEFFESHRNTFMNEANFKAFYWMHFSDQLSMSIYEQLAVTKKSPIIKSDVGYHPYHLYIAEKASYNITRRALSMSTHAISDQQQDIIDKVSTESDIELTDEQMHALTYAFNNPLHIITGGPGTGKTTILHAILKKLELMTGCSPFRVSSPFLLVAPTGKAAFRMQEQTGVMAHTIHSAFGILPGYGCCNVEEVAKKLEHVRYIIIDEASMLDTKVFGDMCLVLQQMDVTPHLLLVGDVDQLPPVGAGQVLSDLLTHVEEYHPQCATRLTILKRQGLDSNIPELSQMIRNGTFPTAQWFEGKSDVIYVPATVTDFEQTLCDKILTPKRDVIDTIQILTPYRNGLTNDTIYKLNNIVSPIYNPKQENEVVVAHSVPSHREFRVGDRVINRQNLTNHIVNGSLGTITHIHNASQDVFTWTITVDYDTEEYVYSYGDWKWLELAYAITVHASQGSEYENVVLLMLRGSNPEFLTRNLLQVAVTRATKRVIIMGDLRTYSQIASTPQKPRKTALSTWLIQGET